MMSRFIRIGFAVISVALIIVAYLVGSRMGHRRGYSQSMADICVKEATNKTIELLHLRRGDPPPGIERGERELQGYLGGIANNTTPEQLGKSGLMEGMYWVKRYRQTFPCPTDDSWGYTNFPFMHPSEHTRVKAFLEALPEPDDFTRPRIEQRFNRELQPASGGDGKPAPQK